MTSKEFDADTKLDKSHFSELTTNNGFPTELNGSSEVGIIPIVQMAKNEVLNWQCNVLSQGLRNLLVKYQRVNI